MDIHYILNGSEKVLSVPVTQNAAHEEELMKSDFVRLSFDDAEGIELPLDAYIVPFTDGVRYSLLEPYKPEQRNEEQWHYEPLFQHPKMYLGKVPFVFKTKDSDNNDTTQLEWDYTGYVGTLLGRFCEQINAALKLSAAESFTYAIVGKIDDIVSTTFSSMDILSGLSNIAGKLSCEYHLDWELKILYFGHITLNRVGVDKPTLEVGVNVGSPSVRSSKDGFWNAFEPQGSTRNISRKAVTGENVQSTIRLSLRNYLVSGIEKYPDGIIYTDGKGNVITKSQFEQSGVSLHLKSLIFDEVYPKLDLYVYDVRSRERYLLDDNKKKVIDHYENGVPVYKRYSIWYMRLAYPTYNQLGEVTAWTDYTIDPTTQIIDGKSLYGAFQPNTKANAESSPLAGRGSGDDGGYGFALNYHTANETIPADVDAGDSGVQIKAGDFEIVFQQDGDLIMPTTAAGGIIPKGKSTPSLLGNIVNLYNIVMDSSFTQSAQNELENVAKKEIANYAKDNNSYSVKAYPDAFEGKDENLQDKNPHLFIGQSVTYKNGDYTLETRVMKLVTNLDYDFVQEITVGNEVIKGTTTTLKEQVQSILSGNAGVGGGGVDENLVRRIIKAFGDTRYLSKINDDTAQGLITLIKGLQVGNQFVSGLLGEGGVFRKEADGKTYLEADKLYIRMKAYFDTIEIRDFKHSAGNRVASPAGAKCVRVAWFNASNEELEQTQENLSSVAYFRCYFRSSDNEDTVRNNFVVGDQVYCHITTVNGADDNPSTKGLNQKHYWRLCIGKNTDNNITEDGEGWVDLSNRSTESIGGENYTGYQTNSDVPEPQDSMVQLGNVNDTTRQGAIIEFVTGDNAPSYQIYQGINSFSLTGRNMITLGYNSATGKAELNVYGDAFIGDPNRTTYIEYVQDDGTDAHAPKLKIKAEVEFTNSQQDLDNFVQSHQRNYDDTEVRGLIDGLQDQIDGQVESWFYNYAPVHVDEHGAPDSSVPLNIAPYSDWTTEADKIAHLGDTFTDNSTGYCWRFSRNEDTNAFEWVVIEDSALISALQKAAKAQETADNKRRVFLVQPTPPYDAGDIWVNATYPANYTGATDEANHKYNNDILKCITAKASGSSFSIEDWTLSSKYTDDTKFNGYISALLNDTGLSGDAAAAAAQRAVLSALGVGTVVSGGLLLTSLIGMRQYKNNGGDKSDINNYTTWAGISGEYNANVKGGGIAAWYGGGMVDHEVNTTATDYAKSLFRFDGSGYLASGNISWNSQGAITIKNITTLSDSNNKNLLNELATFNSAFTFGTAGSGSTTALYIRPNVPFETLYIGTSDANKKEVATKDWANGQFVTKTFFDNIFRLYNGTTKVNVNDTIPSSNNLNIEAMFGFWTKKYISALGQGDDGSTSYSTLAALNDVNISSPAVDQVLAYNGTHWYNKTINLGSLTLAGLSDVTISSPAANQMLGYDATTQKWVNVAVPAKYTLPTATDSVLGGVKVGTTLAIANGVLNLHTTGVTAGTYKRVTVDAYGRVTSGDNTDTDTNTWRNIYVGGTSKVGTGIDTKAINFKAGSNVAISYVAAGTGSGQSGNANYFDVVISATDTTYSAATQSAAGLMSAADKKKLDGIAEGANKYSLPLAASGIRGGVQIGFTTDAANRKYAVQLSSEKMYVNVPWENTWRGIQNNLTSQSTTDSLSAYQGYLLANGSARDNTKLPLTGGTLTGTLTARDVVVQSAYTLKIGDAILKWDSANNALKLYKLSGSSEVAVNFYATGGVSALGMSEDGSAGAGDVTWALLRSNDDERPIAWSHISDAVTAQGYATQSWVTSNFNKYVLPTATTSALGGIKVGYTTSGKNYKVQVDASGNAFVNVPWEAGTGTVTSVKVGSVSYTPTAGVISLPAYPTSLPASDVYSWAKASTKPSYTLDEVSDGSTRKLANYLPLSGGTMSNTNLVTNLNADLLDGWHLGNILQQGYITSGTANLSSYWAKVWEITITNSRYGECDLTFLVSSVYNEKFGIIQLRIRQNGENGSGAYDFSKHIRLVAGNIPLTDAKLYCNNSTGKCELWMNVGGQWGVYNVTILKKCGRVGTDVPSMGELSQITFSTVQTPPSLTAAEVSLLTTYTFSGTATKAIQDSDGNTINSTYLKKSGGTMTGALVIGSGVDLIMKAGTNSSDAGDLLFQNGSGTEIGRIWLADNAFYLRYSNTDARKAILHSGNSSVSKSGETLTVTINGTSQSLTNTNTTYSANNGVGLSGTTFYNSGVRAVSISGNSLRVNTNGTNTDLTIPYATTANQLNTFSIPFQRPTEQGGNGKQWSRLCTFTDTEITTTNKWFGKYAIFEMYTNGYGDINKVYLGRVSFNITMHGKTSFKDDNQIIRCVNLKKDSISLDHFKVVVTDTTVEFFVKNDIWDTVIACQIIRQDGMSIGYNSTYTYTQADFETYCSGKKVVDATLDTLWVGNALNATKLQTPRTIWGQSFDGSGNVSGNMTGVGTISASGNNTITKSNTDEACFAAKNNNGQIELLTSFNRGVYDRSTTTWVIGTNGTNSFLMRGNVGIGTDSPAYKLHVSGTLGVHSAATMGSTLYVADLVSANGGIAVPSSKYVKIGNAYLTYDSDAQALRVSANADGTGAMNFYARGGVSALGQSSDGSSGSGDVTWALLASNSDTRQIALSHLTTSLGTLTSYTTSGKNYAVQKDSNNHLFVNVPWDNTNTTYSAGKGLRLSGTQFISDAPRVTKDSKVFGGANTWIMEEYAHGTAYNLPSDAWYHIMSTQGSDTAYGTQLALGMTTEGAYYRCYNGGSWGSWKSLINTNTTYSANNGVGLSGTTFYNSGVRAVSISGNSLRVNTNGTNADLTIPYATNAGVATRSKFVFHSGISGAAYVSGDTHIMYLGYLEVSNYGNTTLMISSGFWGNQHNSVDLITIANDFNTNGDKLTQATVQRVMVGGSYERKFYCKKETNGNTLRVHLTVHVEGGNGYGNWYISIPNSNDGALWHTDGTKNYNNTGFSEIPFSGKVSYALNAGSSTKATQDSDGNAINATYLKLSGGTMTGVETISPTSAIKIAYVTGSGTRAPYYTSDNYIHGGEDHADQDGANVQIGTWFGFGIYPTISGQTRTQGKNSFWHNARTGNTYTWGDFYSFDGTNNRKVLHTGNSSVSLSGSTLTVTINGTSQSLTNTWRGITDTYAPTTSDSTISLSQTGALNMYDKLTKTDGRWTWGGSGQSAYCLIATINTNSAYINNPITFEINGRGLSMTHITVWYKNQSTVDPDIDKFTTDQATSFYLYKVSANTWNLYGNSSDGVWGNLNLYSVRSERENLVTIKMESVASLPTGYIQPSYTGNVSYATNAGSAAQLTTARTLWGQSFNGTANVSGDMTSVGTITFSSLGGANEKNLLYQLIGDNDYFRLRTGATATNGGWVEIATADDGNEPIYVRQYTGVFSNVARTLTLLDGSGNTSIPKSLSVGNNITVGSADGTYIQIGGARIVWDNTNKALKVIQSDNSTAANFYATGGVSSLGMSEDGSAGVGDVTWALLAATDTRQINLTHITTALGTLTSYTTSGKNYAVQKDSNNHLYVNVPWDNTNTTYSAGAGISLSGTTFSNSGVRSTTINGNYLRVNTNGTNADLVIPYATNADMVDNVHLESILTYKNNIGNQTQNNHNFHSALKLGVYEMIWGGYIANHPSDWEDGSNHYGQMLHFGDADNNHGYILLDRGTQNMYFKNIGGTTSYGLWYKVAHSGNSSVSKSGETLSVTINGTTQSLTNTNTTYSAGNGLALNGTQFSIASNVLVQGSVIDTHHEGNGTITLDGTNELFAFYDRGGTCDAYEVEQSATLTNQTLTRTSTAVAKLSANVFNGMVGYNQTDGIYSGEKFAVYDLALPASYPYGANFFWSFGNGGWKPAKMRVLIGKYSASGFTYISKYSSDACPAYGKVSVDNGATGFDRLRIVVSKYSRLACFGVTFYASTGLRTTYVNRCISTDHLYRSVHPAKDNTWSLGASNLRWAEVRAVNFYGTFNGTATKATQDSDGNTINSTYLKLSGGRVTGKLIVGDAVTTSHADNLEIRTANTTADTVKWAFAIKNNYNNQTNYNLGVGVKLALGSEAEPTKWGGMSYVGDSAYFNSGKLKFYTSSVERGYFSNTLFYVGTNVGIGTTSTSYKLHVNGSFNATSGYINGNTILDSNNSSVSKSGETLTVKINGTSQSLTNTWRGIQDNLTSSTNTTESLSAKQGYLLANGSARDNTKLPLAGGTMTGTLKVKTGYGISDATDNGLLVYHPADWTGVSSSQWGVGAADCEGVIRSSATALKHYRYNDGTYEIIDSKGGQTINSSLQIGSSNGAYLQIGAIRLVYDSSNNAVKVIKSDGGNANFYATGGVSALGAGSDSGGGGGDVTWSALQSWTDTRKIAGSHLKEAYSEFYVDRNGDYTNIYKQVAIVNGENASYLEFPNDRKFYFGVRGDANNWVCFSSSHVNSANANCVGIGDMNPAYTLEVAGTVCATTFQNRSDMRLKNKVEDVTLSVKDVANAPAFKYYWKDKERFDHDLHVGTSAQYWQNALKEVVTVAVTKNNELSMNYGVAALISAITVARKVMTHEEKIALLETRVSALEKENGEQEQLINSLQEELAKFKAA